MHLFAEFLFWAGRLESIVVLLAIFHVLVMLLLRGKPLTRILTVLWFILFFLTSLTLFYDATVGAVSAGIDYIIAHLYGGIWDDNQALSGMIQRWSNVLLPIYIPWLTVWAAGLLAILFGSAVHERAAERGRQETT